MAAFAIIYSNLNPTSLGFQPHVDGVTIPVQPWSIGPKVPMIFGSNNIDGGIFTIATYGANPSAANYSSFLAANFGPAASIVAEQYPLTLPAFTSTGIPGFAAIATVMTEAMLYCPVYQAMTRALSNNIPVYTYLNSHTPHCPVIPLPLPGATHNTEVPFVFGNGVGLPPGGNCSFSAQETLISEALVAAWSAMASTGNPSVEGGLQWPQWDNSASSGLTIVNATSVSVVNYSSCGFWDTIDNTYLNFTAVSAVNTTTNGTGSKSNGVNGREIIGLWGLVLPLSISVLILIG